MPSTSKSPPVKFEVNSDTDEEDEEGKADLPVLEQFDLESKEKVKAASQSKKSKQCDICGGKFRNHAWLYNHWINQHGENPGVKLIVAKAIRSQEKHSEKCNLSSHAFCPTYCTFCGLRFPKLNVCRTHIRKTHCATVLKIGDFKPEAMWSTTKELLNCEFCGKGCIGASELYNHWVKLHNDMESVEEIISEAKLYYEKISEANTFDKRAPVIDSESGRFFPTTMTMRDYRNKHAPQRLISLEKLCTDKEDNEPFEIPFPAQDLIVFTERKQLLAKLPCALCDKEQKSKPRLYKHWLTFHRNNPTVSAFVAQVIESAKEHPKYCSRSAHFHCPRVCERCGVRFNNFQYLRIHMREVHDIVKRDEWRKTEYKMTKESRAKVRRKRAKQKAKDGPSEGPVALPFALESFLLGGLEEMRNLECKICRKTVNSCEINSRAVKSTRGATSLYNHWITKHPDHPTVKETIAKALELDKNHSKICLKRTHAHCTTFCDKCGLKCTSQFYRFRHLKACHDEVSTHDEVDFPCQLCPTETKTAFRGRLQLYNHWVLNHQDDEVIQGTITQMIESDKRHYQTCKLIRHNNCPVVCYRCGLRCSRPTLRRHRSKNQCLGTREPEGERLPKKTLSKQEILARKRLRYWDLQGKKRSLAKVVSYFNCDGNAKQEELQKTKEAAAKTKKRNLKNKRTDRKVKEKTVKKERKRKQTEKPHEEAKEATPPVEEIEDEILNVFRRENENLVLHNVKLEPEDTCAESSSPKRRKTADSDDKLRKPQPDLVPSRSFHCTWCVKEFRTAFMLVAHLTLSHRRESQCEKNLFRCPICELVTDKKALASHIELEHV